MTTSIRRSLSTPGVMPYHLPAAWLLARALRTKSLAVALAGDIGTVRIVPQSGSQFLYVLLDGFSAFGLVFSA